MTQPANLVSPPPKPRLGDLATAVVVLSIFTLHVATLWLMVTPYQGMCFPCIGVDRIVLPLLAIYAIKRLLTPWRKLTPKGRRFRLMLATLLLVLAILFGPIDSKRRIFVFRMRQEIQSAGGASVLQAWALQVLEDQTLLDQFEKRQLPPTKVPPRIAKFLKDWRPFVEEQTPSMYIGTGGWDMGWGVWVARPGSVPIGRVWWLDVQVIDGVHIYAF